MTDLLTNEAYTPALASKTQRFFALFIDYIIYLTCFYFIAKNFGQVYTTDDGGIGISVEGIPALSCFLVWFAQMPLLEALTGKSIGKMVFGITVLKQNGSKASIGNTTVRHLFDIIDWLPFFGIVGLFVASRNEQKQRVGDLVAKTIVVKQ